jgi:uncharacterized membrane protein
MKKPKDSPHVRLYFHMLESKAWNSLLPSSQVLYIKILKEHRGRNENRFKLPYSQSGCSATTTSRCLKELEKFGFIDILQHGGLFHKSNVYALSSKWEKIG